MRVGYNVLPHGEACHLSLRAFLVFNARHHDDMWTLIALAMRIEDRRFACLLISTLENYPPENHTNGRDYLLRYDDQFEVTKNLVITLINVNNYTEKAIRNCVACLNVIMDPNLNSVVQTEHCPRLGKIFKEIWTKINPYWLVRFNYYVFLSNFFNMSYFYDTDWLEILHSLILNSPAAAEMIRCFNRTSINSYSYIGRLTLALASRDFPMEARRCVLQKSLQLGVEYGLGDMSEVLACFGHSVEFNLLFEKCNIYKDRIHCPCALMAYICCFDTDHSDEGHYKLFHNRRARELDGDEHLDYIRVSLGFFALSKKLKERIEQLLLSLKVKIECKLALTIKRLKSIPQTASLVEFSREAIRYSIHNMHPDQYYEIVKKSKEPKYIKNILIFKKKIYGETLAAPSTSAIRIVRGPPEDDSIDLSTAPVNQWLINPSSTDSELRRILLFGSLLDSDPVDLNQAPENIRRKVKEGAKKKKRETSNNSELLQQEENASATSITTVSSSPTVRENRTVFPTTEQKTDDVPDLVIIGISTDPKKETRISTISRKPLSPKQTQQQALPLREILSKAKSKNPKLLKSRQKENLEPSLQMQKVIEMDNICQSFNKILKSLRPTKEIKKKKSLNEIIDHIRLRQKGGKDNSESSEAKRRLRTINEVITQFKKVSIQCGTELLSYSTPMRNSRRIKFLSFFIRSEFKMIPQESDAAAGQEVTVPQPTSDSSSKNSLFHKDGDNFWYLATPPGVHPQKDNENKISSCVFKFFQSKQPRLEKRSFSPPFIRRHVNVEQRDLRVLASRVAVRGESMKLRNDSHVDAYEEKIYMSLVVIPIKNKNVNESNIDESKN